MKVMARCEICKTYIATRNCKFCERKVCDSCIKGGICKMCLPTIT